MGIARTRRTDGSEGAAHPASVQRPPWWSSDHWSTPPELVRGLEREFGPFTLDPCCRVETAKAPLFFTPEQDGLKQRWSGKVFLNPPYSKPAPWLEKAIEEMDQRNVQLVVALLPVRTDTRWFHRLVYGKADVRFIQGRVKWLGWQGTPIPSPKDPSMLAIYA